MAGKGKRGPAKGQRFGGRQKGTLNKVTATVKEAVEQAFNEVGGARYLVEMAYAEPRAFMTLVAKVMPNKIEAEVSVTVRELEDRLAKGRERVASAAIASAVINQEGGDSVH
jgi:hypothetical protein